MSQNSEQTITQEPELLADDVRLLCALQRVLPTPKARLVIWLQLARLPPPLPRAHHRRTAHAILEKAAQLHEGEVFALQTGDMVLLCRAPAHGGTEPGAHPAALPHTLSRLFAIDVPPGSELVETWSLERDGPELLARVARLAA